MPRIRYIKPETFSDEDLADLPLSARLTFIGLWCYADKRGRLLDRPRFLKAMIWPYDEVDIEKDLKKLTELKPSGRPFIQRYTDNGCKLIQIVSWEEHQRPHHTEAESKLPPPPVDNSPPIPPFNIKGMEKGMEKQHNPSVKLNNGEVTVKEPLKAVGPLSLPDFIPMDLWSNFKDHRKKLRKPMTKKAEDLIIKKLTRFKSEGYDPVTLIETMIEKGWQSIELEWIQGKGTNEDEFEKFLKRHEQDGEVLGEKDNPGPD